MSTYTVGILVANVAGAGNVWKSVESTQNRPTACTVANRFIDAAQDDTSGILAVQYVANDNPRDRTVLTP